jgi:hypothetical protein
LERVKAPFSLDKTILHEKNKMSSGKLWVAHKTPERTFGPTKVLFEEYYDVDDFKVAIRNNPELAILPNIPISLFEPDGNYRNRCWSLSFFIC